MARHDAAAENAQAKAAKAGPSQKQQSVSSKRGPSMANYPMRLVRNRERKALKEQLRQQTPKQMRVPRGTARRLRRAGMRATA